MTGSAHSGVELGRVGVVEAADVAGELDDGHLHAEADAEKRHRAARGRSGPRRSCPPCRARRSRRAPGCRRRRSSTGRRLLAARTPRLDSSRCRRSTSLAMPPWTSASLQRSCRRPASSMYLPTTAIVTSPFGCRMRCDDRRASAEVGRRARQRCRAAQHAARRGPARGSASGTS